MSSLFLFEAVVNISFVTTQVHDEFMSWRPAIGQQNLTGDAKVLQEIFSHLMVSCEDKFVGCFILRYIKTRMRQEHDKKMYKRRLRKAQESKSKTIESTTEQGTIEGYTEDRTQERRNLKAQRLDGDSLRAIRKACRD